MHHKFIVVCLCSMRVQSYIRDQFWLLKQSECQRAKLALTSKVLFEFSPRSLKLFLPQQHEHGKRPGDVYSRKFNFPGRTLISGISNEKLWWLVAGTTNYRTGLTFDVCHGQWPPTCPVPHSRPSCCPRRWGAQAQGSIGKWHRSK